MQRFNINWTAKALANQMERGKVNFDNAVQRNLVWDDAKKSLLIHSMIYGYAIPAMYFTRDEDGVYDSLDGKQRSNAISGFLHDEFALSADTPAVVDTFFITGEVHRGDRVAVNHAVDQKELFLIVPNQIALHGVVKVHLAPFHLVDQGFRRPVDIEPLHIIVAPFI